MEMGYAWAAIGFIWVSRMKVSKNLWGEQGQGGENKWWKIYNKEYRKRSTYGKREKNEEDVWWLTLTETSNYCDDDGFFTLSYQWHYKTGDTGSLLWKQHMNRVNQLGKSY